MSKVAIVYWSGTGNTEQMAQQVQARRGKRGRRGCAVVVCGVFRG